MKSTYFDTIVIIQSIPHGELRTGTRLHEDLEILNIAYDHNLRLEIFEAQTKADFFQLLTTLKNEIEINSIRPAIHIETHGASNKKGLVLSSGDYVSWFELKPFLIDINVATRNNLLVFMAACNGAHLSEVIDLTDRAPCWGIVGPTRSVSSENLLKSFYGFYKELLSSGSGGKAINALNCAMGESNGNYHFTNSEMFFEMTYLKYLKTECSKSALETRAKAMYKKLKKDKQTKSLSIGFLKRALKKSQKDYFNNFKNKFFMTDIYPENKDRFTIDYRKIMQASIN